MSSSTGESCRANSIRCCLRILLLAERMSFSPIFTSKELKFHPIAGELKPFANLGIRLVHGWFVPSPDLDTSHEEYAAIVHVNDYQSAQDLINEKHSHGPPMGANAGHARNPSMNKMEKFQIGQYLPTLSRRCAEVTGLSRLNRPLPGAHILTAHVLRPETSS
jgi:MINDY deubiquitinase